MRITAARIRPQRRRRRTLPRTDRSARVLRPIGWPALFSLLTGLAGGAFLSAFRPAACANAFESMVTAFLQTGSASFSVWLRCILPPAFGLGLLIVYLGFSPLGRPGILALLGLRGCGLGALAAWLASLGKNALRFYYLCFFPGKALQLCGLFLLAGRAMQLSGYYKSCILRDSGKAAPAETPYLKACMPGMAVLLVSAVTDTLLYWKISPSFWSLLG